MKRLLPFVVTMLVLLFPALASAQSEQGKITITQVEHCTIKVTYADDLGNEKTVNSGDRVPNRTLLTLSAKTDEGFMLLAYIVNGQKQKPLPSGVSHTYVNGDMVISGEVVKVETMAITIEQPEHGEITVKDADDNYAVVSSGEKVMIGHTLRIEMTPNAGYQIVHWVIDGKKKTLDNKFPNKTLEVVKAPLKISAVMEPIPSPCKLTLIIDPEESGTFVVRYEKYGQQEIKDLDHISKGKEVWLLVQPRGKYKIKKWIVDGEEREPSKEFDQNRISFIVNKDMVVKAVLGIPDYLITLESEGEGMLTATDGDGNMVNSGVRVKEGTKLTFKATPSEGYEVGNWTVNGKIDFRTGKSTTLEKEITADTKVTVSFKKKPEPVKEFTITVNAVEPAEAGIITVTDDKGNEVKTGAKIAQGTMLTVTAEAMGKYEFESFTINKEVKGKDTEGVTMVTDKKKYTYKLEVKGSTVIGATFSKPTSAEDILAQTEEFAVVNGSIYCPGARMIALYTMDSTLVRTIEAEVMEVRDLAAGNYLVIATNREGVALQKKIVL